MKVWLKQVPRSSPRADGVWIQREIPKYPTGSDRFAILSQSCDAGHVCVAVAGDRPR